MFFIMLSCFYCVLVLVSFSLFLFNQNNPTAVWLRLTGMHNEKNKKHDFWKQTKKQNWLSVLHMNSSYIAITNNQHIS